MIFITTAHLSLCNANMLGEYNISKAGSTITHNGVAYVYIATGLCREVYYSQETQSVIKIPKARRFPQEDMSFIAQYDVNDIGNPSIDHNIAEAQMYEECPEDLKQQLPTTTLLDNGWIKQDYCRVIKLDPRHSDYYTCQKALSVGAREWGIYKGGATVFDFCFMMKDFKKPLNGWDWKKLEHYLETLKSI